LGAAAWLIANSGNLQPDVSMLIQPQGWKALFDHTRNEGGGLADDSRSLVLPGKIARRPIFSEST